MHIHVPFIGDKANSAVRQAFGTAHILYRIAERQFEDRDQAGKLGRSLWFFLLPLFGRRYFLEIDATAGRRLKGLFFIGTDRRDPKFVNWIGHQEDLDPARSKAFELRALF